MKNYSLNKVRELNSFKDLLRENAEVVGEKLAFRYKSETEKDKVVDITYKQFYEDVNSLGTALASYGMADKHVAIISENSYKYVTVYLSVLNSKGVIVPIDKELTCEQLINVLKHSDTDILFYSARYEDWIENIKKECKNIKFFVGLSKDKKDDVSFGYTEFIEEGRKTYTQGSTIYTSLNDDENNLKMLVYTSGTTGNPKGVMLTEHNLKSVCYYGLQVADIHETSLSVLPYHHTYEAVAGLLVQLYNRSTICINDSLKNVLKNIQLFKPDFIYLVPAFTEVFYKNIWANAEKTGKAAALRKGLKISNALRKVGIDLRRKIFKSVHEAFGGNLIEIVCGGAPIRPDVGRFFNDIGITLLNGYGITECSPLVSVNRLKFNDPATVGVILPCCEIKINNPDEDGDGEIWVKGDIVMKGYYKEEEKTAKVLKDGWFNTEDIGKVNDKGQLCINGRKKNLIVLANGKNVYPEEIENFILTIPYVKECIVKGRVNESGQETALIAEVYLDPESEEAKKEDIKDILKKEVSLVTKELPLYKKIADIEIRDTEFNKTTTAKIKR